jgi:hypothetical protein
MSQLTSGRDIAQLARKSLRNPSDEILRQIEAILSEDRLAFSTHRPYGSSWKSNLQDGAARLSSSWRLLVPRIPSIMLDFLQTNDEIECSIIPADRCSKAELMALRQLHRTSDQQQRENPDL